MTGRAPVVHCPSTSTARWADVRRKARPWVPPDVPMFVVVPHPDDEALGCGGLIAHQRARGVPVTVCAVTDGEAAYPGAVVGAELARLRRDEQVAALGELGVATPAVRLALPDGAVARHEAALADRLTALADGAGLLVAPWFLDHHADHEACGRAAGVAAGRLGVPVVHSLFWAWHYATIDDLLAADLLALPLDHDARERRRRALACHETQLTDLVAPRLLGGAELEPITWPTEYLVAASGRP